MKVKRLIQEEDSITKTRRVAMRECPAQEARPAEKAVKEKENSMRKKPCITEDQSTAVEQSRASKKDKGNAILTEDVLLRQNEVLVESTRTKDPREEAVEVLTVSLDTEEDLVALEEVAAKAVEDVAAAKSGPQKVISPRTSTDTVILEMDEEPSADDT